MRSFSRSLSAFLLLGLIAVTRASDGVIAQSAPPRANVSLTRLPLGQQVFPADFNRDGRTDLVGTQRSFGVGPIHVSLGNGDGTFGDPTTVGLPASVVLGVTDFNNDGRTDILAFRAAGEAPLVYVVPNTTSGFGPPIELPDVVVPYEFHVAVTADFDADGRRDFAIVNDTIHIYSGNGDFTFDVRGTVANTGWNPRAAVVADLNGDNRSDLAVTTLDNGTLNVHLNEGGFLFSSTSLSLGSQGGGVTAWDLDGDGDRELIAGTGEYSYGQDQFFDGYVNVFVNNGNGTFQTPRSFATGDGPVAVVGGDFNRDGIADIATANYSNRYNARCDGSGSLSASISILPGLGTGSLGAPATFALASGATTTDDLYRRIVSLRTADVNGDGRTDLVAGPGALLLNAAAAANRPPVANAGPDQPNAHSSGGFVLNGSATDPDHDWLTYEWRDEAGRVLGDQPFTCVYEDYAGPETFTLTVSDGRGGVSSDTVIYNFYDPDTDVPVASISRPTAGERIQAGQPYRVHFSYTGGAVGVERFDIASSSDDGTTWTPIAECTNVPSYMQTCTWRSPGPVSASARIRITATDSRGLSTNTISGRFEVLANAGGPGGLPAGWSRGDVGAIGAAGTASHSNGTFTVTGAGADIWGTADEFHFAWQALTGGFAITARVTSVQNVNQWTKAGLMIRDSAGAGAAHASIFVTPSTVKGTAFQRRPSTAAVSVSTPGPAITAPAWIRLMRTGNRITAYVRKSTTDRWTLVGEQMMSDLPETVLVGFAVSSHVDGRLATATFDNVTVSEGPTSYGSGGVGNVGVPGSTSGNFDFVNVQVTGSGADIWDTADAFRFLAAWSWGDTTATVQVRSLTNTHAWAKTGVMFRETTTPGSKHVFLLVSPGKGVALQYRNATGGASAQAALIAGTAPEYLRLRRRGDTFTAWASEDGLTWRSVGSVTVPMTRNVTLMLPVTSHDNGRLATAVIDELVIAD